MAYRYLLVDDATGRQKRGDPVTVSNGDPLFIDEKYSVTSSTQNTFYVNAGIANNTRVDVFVDGVLKDEGSLDDYIRDAAAETIIFNYYVNPGSKVRIRVYLF